MLAASVRPTRSFVSGRPSLVEPRMRAVALLLFVMNFIGLGLGPVVVGSLSNALLAVPPVYLWATYHYEAAARTISADLRDATRAEGEAP